MASPARASPRTISGALLCAWTIASFGSRWPMAFCALGGAATAFSLETVKVAQNAGLLIVGLGAHGLFVNATQSTLFAFRPMYTRPRCEQRERRPLWLLAAWAQS